VARKSVGKENVMMWKLLPQIDRDTTHYANDNTTHVNALTQSDVDGGLDDLLAFAGQVRQPHSCREEKSCQACTVS